MEHGYIVVRGAFPAQRASEWCRTMWIRLGMDPLDKSTWTKERVHMPWHKRESVSTFAPKVRIQGLAAGFDVDEEGRPGKL